MIGRSGERGSGISMLTARHDDDDFFCEVQKKARGLEVLGEEKGAVLYCLYILRGPS